MCKRLLAMFLALCLLTTGVFAVANSCDNFVRTKTYRGQFSDLEKNSVFYSNVSSLYEYGLSIGKSDGTFGLKDSLTVGQAVIFAGRIRSLYRTGTPESGASQYRAPGQPAALPYLQYLKAEGILHSEFDSLLTTVATRSQMAHVLAHVLPDNLLEPINQDAVTEGYATHQFIKDVTEYTPYFRDILLLYRSGICIGVDKDGNFQPSATITRGAAAAMLTRLVDPSLRLFITLDSPSLPSLEHATLGSLVPAGRAFSAPANEAELEQTILSMLSAGENELTLNYHKELSVKQIRQLLQASLRILKRYCEQSYNTAKFKFSSKERITFIFSAVGVKPEDLKSYREQSLRAAKAVHNQLWQSGLLTNKMTDYEKAQAYFEWICKYSEYDSSADDSSLSHLPYGLFQTRKGVCDGYTGAYNLLLKLEGIPCRAVFSGNHIWTAAVLDGTEVHIDTTWADDGTQGIDMTYFAMTPEQSALLHKYTE